MRHFSILTYHSLDDSGSVVSVSPRRFADQMAALNGLGYRGIALREALAQREENGDWPERCVALTFDDGYDSVRKHALPVLCEHGFSATLYVVSGHVGGTNDWSTTPPKLGIHPLMTWDRMRECAAAGLEIGAHTMTHRDLKTLTPEQIDQELTGCRRDIEARLEQPCDSFAYPYGRVSPAAHAAAAGMFRCSCTTVLKRAANEDAHLLPRLDMYYFRTQTQLERLVTGRLDRYLTLRRWGRAARGSLAAVRGG